MVPNSLEAGSCRLRRPRVLFVLLVAAAALAAGPLCAQPSTLDGPVEAPSGTFRSDRLAATEIRLLRGGLPEGPATAETLELGILDAVARGLRNNLAIAVGGAERLGAEGEARIARSALLPSLEGRVGQYREEFNLAVTSFRDFPDFPAEVVGPFDAFDARLSLHQAVFDLPSLARLRAARAGLEAQQMTYRERRDRVVLAISSLYYATVTSREWVSSAEAREASALSLLELARDRHASGLVPGIEPLRAEVEYDAARMRTIVARNRLAEAELRLARAIGLPIGQAFVLTDTLHFRPLEDLSLEQALERALGARPDVLAARARVEEARRRLSAERAEHLPTIELEADWGTIGPSRSDTDETFAVGARLDLPLYRGGELAGRRAEAEARLRTAEATLGDLEALAYYEIRLGLLDAEAAEGVVRVAQSSVTLSERQLEQARSRFSAGVSDTIEVVQAQESLVRAQNAWFEALLQHQNAKGALALAIGLSEDELLAYLTDLYRHDGADR